eukprot:scaffold20950_cov151-Isochrysis_galbana.AAC.2
MVFISSTGRAFSSAVKKIFCGSCPLRRSRSRAPFSTRRAVCFLPSFINMLTKRAWLGDSEIMKAVLSAPTMAGSCSAPTCSGEVAATAGTVSTEDADHVPAERRRGGKASALREPQDPRRRSLSPVQRSSSPGRARRSAMRCSVALRRRQRP